MCEANASGVIFDFVRPGRYDTKVSCTWRTSPAMLAACPGKAWGVRTLARRVAPGHASWNRSVSAEPVALILRCEECRRVWLPADEGRWRAYLTIDDEIGFYRSDCAHREFADDATGA
jgi:hypothetical protein